MGYLILGISLKAKIGQSFRTQNVAFANSFTVPGSSASIVNIASQTGLDGGYEFFGLLKVDTNGNDLYQSFG